MYAIVFIMHESCLLCAGPCFENNGRQTLFSDCEILGIIYGCQTFENNGRQTSFPEIRFWHE